ncbi:hypothetical protein B7R22_12570 [Subtercola boreus]|uniref:Ig-like domain-containing protein n=1 Tax=Subtercola boreus TaxID=120213 RepID=A0A3E0VVI7_9MICO|nr:hypothetical protein [Subtercola boreus]RFA13499.1 hypothetical protein B7R22_12570 [Subtercola boreus]
MKKIPFLVLGVIVVVGAALGIGFAIAAPPNPGSTPPASASASTFPTPTPSVPPTPRTTAPTPTAPSPSAPATGPSDAGDAAQPAFGSGSATASVTCPVPGEGPTGSTASSPDVQLSWSSNGAETAFVGVDTTDARAEPYSEVSPGGSISIPFACPAQSHTYTITLVGTGGQRSKTFTVQNTGYRG